MKYIVYPVTMVLAFTSMVFLIGLELPYKAISYSIAVVAALFLTFLEWKFAFRKDWLPQKFEIFTDAIFVVLVQIILPFLLSFSVLKIIEVSQLSLEFWPSHWPVWAQTSLMLIGAEFFRYWLHRKAHTWKPLWKLHAVHHAPDKIYWLNTGRFHPLEKSIQFLVDSLPFIIMGVGEDVMAAYFVFYAVNGFFQHSNVKVRLGPLNYIIAGPELHRWHHSKVMKEANTNYGNNLIIWDLIFGTWFLPKDREVKNLGISYPGYTGGFVSLLKAPFVKRRKSS